MKPTTEAGRRLLAAIGTIMAVIHGIAVADLPENIAANAKMPDDVRREFERTILAVEDEARADLLARLRADVEGLDDSCAGSYATGHSQWCWKPRVLDILDRAAQP